MSMFEHKLKEFPSVNYISVEDTLKRRDLLHNKLRSLGIDNVTPHIFKRYDDSEHKYIGENYKSLTGISRGPVTSHLKAIKDWYFNTDEDYTFFCEDDISFETVEYWNFTWNEFFEKLPSDWGSVQLCWVREVDEMFRFSNDGVYLRPRCWCDWSACAYLIKRSHAKKLIASYYRNGEFNLDYVGNDASVRPAWALRPTAETIIFSQLSPIYGVPLFVEDVNGCKSVLTDNYRQHNFYSYNTIIDWWKTSGHIKKTMVRISA